MQAAGLSDIGQARRQNQDSIFFSVDPVGPLPNLFIVADGMGGHNAGEVASREAVALFTQYIETHTADPDDFLDLCVSAARFANEGVYRQACENPEYQGMGTTFSACFIQGGACRVVHVGDSRVYMAAPGRALAQLTQDHSYVSEMVRAGQLTPEQARTHPRRNILTRVLGVSDTVELDGYTRGLDGAGVILLCSDGLYGMLSDEEIAAELRADTPPEQRAQALVDAANAAGGMDNISVVIISVA